MLGIGKLIDRHFYGTVTSKKYCVRERLSSRDQPVTVKRIAAGSRSPMGILKTAA